MPSISRMYWYSVKKRSRSSSLHDARSSSLHENHFPRVTPCAVNVWPKGTSTTAWAT